MLAEWRDEPHNRLHDDDVNMFDSEHYDVLGAACHSVPYMLFMMGWVPQWADLYLVETAA